MELSRLQRSTPHSGHNGLVSIRGRRGHVGGISGDSCKGMNEIHPGLFIVCQQGAGLVFGQGSPAHMGASFLCLLW